MEVYVRALVGVHKRDITEVRERAEKRVGRVCPIAHKEGHKCNSIHRCMHERTHRNARNFAHGSARKRASVLKCTIERARCMQESALRNERGGRGKEGRESTEVHAG